MNLLLALTLLTWDKFDLSKTYQLTSDVALTSEISLSKDSKFKLVDIEGLDEINVQFFEFEMTPCPDAMKNEQADMIIFEGLYGVELLPGCKVDWYVELTDYYKHSPFSL